MLMLTRKLGGGSLLIKDRVVKVDEDGKPMFDENGDEVIVNAVRVLKATDADLYEAKEYGDEEYVLQHHGAILAKPQDVPDEWWEKMKSRIRNTKRP